MFNLGYALVIGQILNGLILGQPNLFQIRVLAARQGLQGSAIAYVQNSELILAAVQLFQSRIVAYVKAGQPRVVTTQLLQQRILVILSDKDSIVFISLGV